jgi:hypothetical protein
MLSDLLSIVRTEPIRGSCVENKLQSWLARNDTTVRHDRKTSAPHCLAERCHDNPGKITCTISYIHDLYVSYKVWTAYFDLRHLSSRELAPYHLSQFQHTPLCHVQDRYIMYAREPPEELIQRHRMLVPRRRQII